MKTNIPPHIEEIVKEFREKMWSPENKMGSALWHDDMQEASCEWLKTVLSSTYKEGYLKALEDVKKEIPERYVHKNNPNHEKEEYWGCCDCYDDSQKNVNRSATLSAISRLENQNK